MNLRVFHCFGEMQIFVCAFLRDTGALCAIVTILLLFRLLENSTGRVERIVWNTFQVFHPAFLEEYCQILLQASALFQT